MNPTNTGTNSPISILLAADARLSTTRYIDDQVWELHLGGGEPPALAIQTTYGLRVRSMRIYPNFIQGGAAVCDPVDFTQRPELAWVYPNACAVRFSPFPDIDVFAEYWVPESWLLVGRLHISNSGEIRQKIILEQTGQLVLMDEGEPMAPFQSQVTSMLAGKTRGLNPVLFLTGGPEPGNGSQPSLAIETDLAPGETRQLTWALASLPSQSESFEEVRKATARPWEAELTRIEMINTHDRILVNTGSIEMDRVFQQSQDAAFRLLMSPTTALPAASFVVARLPDQGWSQSGDGMDYGPLWSGQTAFQSLAISRIYLPGAAALVEGFVRNQLTGQDLSGQTDWKVGLAGQRGWLHAQPILATLAWRASLEGENPNLLRETYPALQRYLAAWFSREHDRDADGYPEWDHPYQAALEDIPLFDRWHPSGQGAEISAVESPALGACLFREFRSMMQIARCLGRENDIPSLDAQAGKIRDAVQSTWDATTSSYRYRDRDTHTGSPGECIYQGAVHGVILLDRELATSQRLIFRVETAPASGQSIHVRVFGRNQEGPIEESLLPRSWQWSQEVGWASSQAVFSAIDRVEVTGLFMEEMSISTPPLDGQDLSLFFPLWAGIPTPEQAGLMVARLMKHYAQPYGLTCLPDDPQSHVLIPWNCLVLEGLLEYQYRQEAVDLFSALVKSAAISLDKSGAFFRQHMGGSGQPSGEHDHLGGLIPLDLLLKIRGIDLRTPWKMIITGNGPAPWPFVVKYRGLKVIQNPDQTDITFPNGQTTTVTGSGSFLVTQERGFHPNR
ncbi:MAG: hypothetical protein PHQ40_06260 [Anaerolineaceae bacterium]|nr:hypothetical protein [Anaerolineaceae bacterium]